MGDAPHQVEEFLQLWLSFVENQRKKLDDEELRDLMYKKMACSKLFEFELKLFDKAKAKFLMEDIEKQKYGVYEEYTYEYLLQTLRRIIYQNREKKAEDAIAGA